MDISQDDLLKMIGMREVQIMVLRKENAVLRQTIANMHQERLDKEADEREAQEANDGD